MWEEKKKSTVFPSIFNGVSSPSYFLGQNKNILQKGLEGMITIIRVFFSTLVIKVKELSKID